MKIIYIDPTWGHPFATPLPLDIAFMVLAHVWNKELYKAAVFLSLWNTTIFRSSKFLRTWFRFKFRFIYDLKHPPPFFPTLALDSIDSQHLSAIFATPKENCIWRILPFYPRQNWLHLAGFVHPDRMFVLTIFPVFLWIAPPQFNMEPEVMMVSNRNLQTSRGWFSGSMLNFAGVFHIFSQVARSGRKGTELNAEGVVTSRSNEGGLAKATVKPCVNLPVASRQVEKVGKKHGKVSKSPHPNPSKTELNSWSLRFLRIHV